MAKNNGFGTKDHQEQDPRQEPQKVDYAKTPDAFMDKAMRAGAEQIFAMANQVSEAQMPQVIDNVARLNAMRLAQANASGEIATKTLEYVGLDMNAAQEKSAEISNLIEQHFSTEIGEGNPDFFTKALSGGSSLPQLKEA